MNLNSTYERVKKFNYATGKEPVVGNMKQKEDQFKRIVEEVIETSDALKDGDWKEILDGVCDITYTLFYFIELLKAEGVDVEGALEAVCDNNDQKYTESLTLVQESLIRQMEVSGEACYIGRHYYENELYYCIKRAEDDKVMKLKYHQSPDLIKYLGNLHLGVENV